ncbi:B-box domain protein 30-like [Juglans microcarpa x Juglans regia]|uniref:B-box domain protein 30-like n=1 Tax=Juglans microcarpa x Juglans regia TaxID=2249226 RepID=UPI001B7F5F8F|nr:B-box domain protein 30-like [Juglans microcarpa x Juglans regia]
MCQGQEEGKFGGLCRLPIPGEAALRGASTGSIMSCELCGARASLYCQADDAFLCRNCDKWVHGANFLALRHIRCFLCNTCQKLTQRYLLGASVEVVLPSIRSWMERSHCNSGIEKECSGKLKRPVLWL